MATPFNRKSPQPVMPKNESSKIGQLVKSVLSIVLIVVASIGATLFYFDRSGIALGLNTASAEVPAEQQPAAPLPNPIFEPLEPFTVTLRNERGNRILYVAVTLRVPDETSRRMIVNYMPEVRDRILRDLSEQQADYIQTTEGRAALVRALTQTLQAPYAPQPTGPVITSVLFTAFVIQ